MDNRPPAPSPREVWEEAHRHVKAYDLVGFAEMFAVDGVLELPFAPTGVPGRFEGREAIRRFLAPAAEAARKAGHRIVGYRDVVVHQTQDPQVIVVEFDLQGAGPNDHTYCFSYIQVMRTRDREIAHLRDYIDPRVFRGVR